MHRMKQTQSLHQIQKTRLKRDLKYRTVFKKIHITILLLPLLFLTCSIVLMFSKFVLCPCKNLIGKLYN